MAIDYTTTGMIASIKRRGVLPDSQILYDPDDLVNIMTEELQSIIVPLIMAVREEYFVVNVDQSISTNQNTFFIPFRAIGMKLRDVVLVNSQGTEIPLPRYSPEDIKNQINNSRFEIGVYLDNDRVLFIPTTTDYSAYTLRMKIFRRPNNLIQASQSGKITAINTVTKQVTLATLPSIFTTSLTYDFIKGMPSFRAHAEAQPITTILGFVLTFTNALPSDLAVGDYVAETGFSPIPQIPYEVHRLLEQRVVVKIMEGLKDSTGRKLAIDNYDEMVKEFERIVTPRVDGAPKKVVSTRGIARHMGSIGVRW